MSCDCLVKGLGYTFLAVLASKLLQQIWQIVYPFFLGPRQNLHKLAGKDWAVITGATDGIGKAYAVELAKQKFNLLLVSRTQSKLDATADEIKEKYGVKVDTIAFDFNTGDLEVYKANLLSKLDNYEIGILVNNVGLSYEYPEQLHKLHGGIERVANITTINTLPVTVLSAHVLAKMAPRKNGVIVNISSSASATPMRFWAIYSATKKYVRWLTEILQKEYQPEGVTIQSVVPMMVATKMSKVRRASFFVPEATTYARAAVATIGLTNETTGFWTHELQHNVYFKILPSFVFAHLCDSNSVATRKRALKKIAEKDK